MKRFGFTTLAFTSNGNGTYSVIGIRSSNGTVLVRTFNNYDNASRQAQAWDHLPIGV
jgi:hypothetical protein